MDGFEQEPIDTFELIERGVAAERRIREGAVEAVLELAEVNVAFEDNVADAVAARPKRAREHRLLILQDVARAAGVHGDEVQQAVDAAELPALALDGGRHLVARQEDWEEFMHERAIHQLTDGVAPIVSMIFLLHGIERDGLAREVSYRCAIRAAGVFSTLGPEESLTARIAPTVGATLRRGGFRDEPILVDELTEQCGRYLSATCPTMAGLRD